MRRLAPLFCLLCAGCAAPGALWVELGAGESEFQQMDGEPVLPLIAGPQGGHHVWIALRVEGMASSQADLLVDVIPIGEETPRRAPIRVHLTETAGGTTELVGWPAVVIDPGCHVGERVLVRATLTDEAGATGTDERIVVLGDGPLLPSCP